MFQQEKIDQKKKVSFISRAVLPGLFCDNEDKKICMVMEVSSH